MSRPLGQLRFILPDLSHGVSRTPGGAVLASLGASSDDVDAELAEVARALAEELARPHEPARVLDVEGTLSLSHLQSGTDAPSTLVPSPVLWCLHAGTARELTSDPLRLQSFLRIVARTGRGVVPPRTQHVYIVDAPSSATKLLARWLQDLGACVWFPEEGAMWMEITRETGEIEAIRVGAPYPSAESPRDAFLLRVNAHKDHAEETCDAAGLAALEETERAYLKQHTEAILRAESSAPLYRSPRLLQLLRSLESDPDPSAALVRLAEALLAREAPLVMTREPGKGFGVRVIGDAGKALFASVDVRSAEWLSEDTGMETGSYEIVGAPAKAVFQMATRGNYGVALCAFEDRSTPMVVMLPATLVRSLADGVVPRAEDLRSADMAARRKLTN